MRRRTASEEVEDCEDALEHVGLTVTRRTWPVRHEAAPKHVSAGVAVTNTSSWSGSSFDAPLGDGLTATITSGSTPRHSTLTAGASPTSTHGQQRNREVSIDLVWGERDEAAEVGVHAAKTVTPSTVLTRAPRPPEWNHDSSPAVVRRRLSLHEEGRRSGTTATPAMIVPHAQQTPSPEVARLSLATQTPTPWNRMPPLLPVRDPPTESRELSMRPSYTLPSPRTPLWTALENEDDDDDEEREDAVAGLHDNAVVRLPLARRPSSFAHHAPSPSLVSSPSGAVVPAVTDASTAGERLQDPESHAAATAGHKRSRLAEEARKAQTDAWVEEMRSFFARIEERPLLTVTVDD
ncbi:hypothetical protein TraAM80_07555 [Trypanosoma rangeli]|uniref:Uncharacterized protein n=1 Tax=Trypanosoma rangeli TaxID=5698 RepID=A0A3R7M712_TRYRA|nr:uncharacterized protein TraAM80_07555 [Trypanosoma rangeli]RNF00631.1 hypothetical protein TraAM80_07555 [Trypanosoma rangeli]|eukprot:RNF00631.1 hypothetical protein TraAM80_07555 [Trypanosoma rangeli]